ncbi:MAG: 30S ribosomal subunit protein S20 [Candidatus Westeberhardia cardiocondylae]|nr:30S ribosomal subunit protein S20 [Candidatus Westeberhardia cardiocondylae]
MVYIKSNKKSIIQSEKKRKFNISRRSMIKTLIKRVISSINSGDKCKAENNFSFLKSILDRQANKNLLHKNKASRFKSNLALKINNM